jgi:hypothetical protein
MRGDENIGLTNDQLHIRLTNRLTGPFAFDHTAAERFLAMDMFSSVGSA